MLLTSIKKNNAYSILTFFLFFSFSDLFGQVANDDFIFNHLNSSDGLCDNKVYSLLQDNLGLMWFGTANGLSRFDGVHFKNFRFDNQDENSLPDNRINRLAKDKFGTVWIATSGGLCFYHPNYHKITRLQEKQYAFTKIKSEILVSKNNHLWIFVNGDIYDFIIEGMGVLKLAHKYHFRPDPIANPCRLFEDKEGNILFKTFQPGICQLDARTHTTKIINLERDSTKAKEHHGFLFHQSSNGDYWFGYAEKNRNLIRYFPETGKTEEFSLISLSDVSMREIIERKDKDGNIQLWIPTFGGAILIFDTHSNTISHLHKALNNTTSIQSDINTSIFLSKEGVIWVGTINGVAYCNPQELEMRFRAVSNEALDKIGGFINTVIPDKNYKQNHILWFGTWEAGVFSYNTETRTSEVFLKPDNSTLPFKSVSSLYQQADGNLWIGTFGNGIYCLNTKTKRLTLIRPKDVERPDLQEFIYKEVTDIYESKSGTLVLSSPDGLGLYDILTNQVRRFRHPNVNEKLFVDGLVSVEGKNNDYYVASSLDNFWKVNAVTNQKTHIAQSIPEAISKEWDGWTNCAYFDESERLWIGYDKGLFRLETKTKQYKNFSILNILTAGELVSSITPLKDNYLYIKTQEAIYKLNAKKDSVEKIFFVPKQYDISDRYNGIKKIDDTHFVFAANKGYVIFEPKQGTQAQIPALVISEIRIDNKLTMPVEKDSSYLPIVLQPSDELLSLDLAVLDYNHPEQSQIAYRLEGLNENWTYLDKQKQLSFAHLSPGNYTLKLKGANGEGIWNEKGIEIRIQVLPYFWETWWFIGGLSLAFLLGIYSFYRVRFNWLRGQNAVLEQKVEQRTFEIQGKNNEIQSQNDEISAQAEELIQMNDHISQLNNNLEKIVEERTEQLKKKNEDLDFYLYRSYHDFRRPITSIIGLAEMSRFSLAAQETDDILGMISETAVQMDKMLRKLQMLYYLDKNEETKEPINFEEIAIELDKFFAIELKKESIVLSKYIENSIDFQSHRQLLDIILKNLIENSIVFHSNDSDRKPEISLKIQRKNDFVLMEVNDNGTGIEESIKEQIFEWYFRGNERSQGNGLGLYLVKEAIKKLNGEIKFESTINTGSVFTVKLPT